MMEGTIERTVQVWDKTYKVSVQQKSKSVWVATGDYMGKRLECEGSSANSAPSAWRKAAGYQGS
jgi:hypothetical protein